MIDDDLAVKTLIQTVAPAGAPVPGTSPEQRCRWRSGARSPRAADLVMLARCAPMLADGTPAAVALADAIRGWGLAKLDHIPRDTPESSSVFSLYRLAIAAVMAADALAAEGSDAEAEGAGGQVQGDQDDGDVARQVDLMNLLCMMDLVDGGREDL